MGASVSILPRARNRVVDLDSGAGLARPQRLTKVDELAKPCTAEELAETLKVHFLITTRAKRCRVAVMGHDGCDWSSNDEQTRHMTNQGKRLDKSRVRVH